MQKLLLSVVLVFQFSMLLADGELDTSFGVDGMVETEVNGKSAHAQTVAIQSNGTIVIAGGTTVDQFNWDFVVVYYDANGTQDPIFGDILENYGSAYAVSVQKSDNSEEKIVAAGDYYLVRYNTDGTLDPTFGSESNGKVSVAINVRSILIQQDGKIVVAGWKSEGWSTDIAVARYSPDGVIDTTFGEDKNGIVKINIGETDRAYSVTTDGSKNILVSGSTNIASILGNTDLKVAVIRLDENGTSDLTFGENGIVVKDLTVNIDDIGTGIAVDNIGRIVIGGTSGNGGSGKYMIMCLDGNGELNNEFGTNGIATGNINGYITDLILQDNDKILVSGMSGDDVNSYFTVARYTVGGNLDTLFGTDGITTLNFGSDADVANAIAVQNDGKIIATGSNGVVGSSDLVIARFQGEEYSLSVPLSPVYYLLLN